MNSPKQWISLGWHSVLHRSSSLVADTGVAEVTRELLSFIEGLVVLSKETVLFPALGMDNLGK